MTNVTKKRIGLGPLPNTDVIKMTVILPCTLKLELERYAAAYSQAYGESTDVATLIPHMLETFISRDRSYKKAAASMRVPTTPGD